MGVRSSRIRRFSNRRYPYAHYESDSHYYAVQNEGIRSLIYLMEFTMGTQQKIHAAVLDGLGHTPRYESFPAPIADDGEAVVTVTVTASKPSDHVMA
jgi:hypothetical protein